MAKQIISALPFGDRTQSREPTMDELLDSLRGGPQQPRITSTPLPAYRPEPGINPPPTTVRATDPVPTGGLGGDQAQQPTSVPYSKNATTTVSGGTETSNRQVLASPDEYGKMIGYGMESDPYLALSEAQQKLRELYNLNLTKPVQPDISPVGELLNSWYGTKFSSAGKPPKREDSFSELLKMQSPEYKLQRLALDAARLSKMGTEGERTVTETRKASESGVKPASGLGLSPVVEERRNSRIVRMQRDIDNDPDLKLANKAKNGLYRASTVETGDVEITPTLLNTLIQDVSATLVQSGHLTDQRIKRDTPDLLHAQLASLKQWAKGDTTDLRDIPQARPTLKHFFNLIREVRSQISKATLNRLEELKQNAMRIPDPVTQDAITNKIGVMRQQYEALGQHGTKSAIRDVRVTGPDGKKYIAPAHRALKELSGKEGWVVEEIAPEVLP